MPDITHLNALLPTVPIQAFDETTSTNTIAREWLKQGGSVGSLVVADRQTGGRGRMGRVFYSEPGGLYMSIVLPGNHQAGEITTLCAVAVRRVVMRLCGLSLSIKWVNDLLYQGKKVCGILCEGVWLGDEALGMIAGIGLNVCQTAFPPELEHIAASLFPSGLSPLPTEAFIAAIYQEIFVLLPLLPAHMSEYRAHCVTLGKNVHWTQNGHEYSGVALDADTDGALLVRTGAQIIRLAAGEVSIRAGN